MSINTINNVGGAQQNFASSSGGADPKSIEGMQSRFDDIKSGKSENSKDDLKSLKKDVDEAQQKEESKAGGGDDKLMDMLIKLLEMIMKMMKQLQGGDEEGGGEDPKAKSKASPAQ